MTEHKVNVNELMQDLIILSMAMKVMKEVLGDRKLPASVPTELFLDKLNEILAKQGVNNHVQVIKCASKEEAESLMEIDILERTGEKPTTH